MERPARPSSTVPATLKWRPRVLLVGEMGSGKSLGARFLTAIGYQAISCGTVIAELARREGIGSTRYDLQIFGARLLARNGAAWFAKELLGRAVRPRVVVEGLRSASTARLLRAQAGAWIVYISASLHVRNQRAMAREGMSESDYARSSTMPIESEVEKTRAFADATVNNDGDVGQFEMDLLDACRVS